MIGVAIAAALVCFTTVLIAGTILIVVLTVEALRDVFH